MLNKLLRQVPGMISPSQFWLNLKGRLQKKVWFLFLEPGHFTQNFCTQYLLDSKLFWTPNFLEPTFFWTKIFWTLIFWTQTLWDLTFFDLNFFDPKLLGIKFFGHGLFLDQTFFGLNFFLTNITTITTTKTTTLKGFNTIKISLVSSKLPLRHYHLHHIQVVDFFLLSHHVVFRQRSSFIKGRLP